MAVSQRVVRPSAQFDRVRQVRSHEYVAEQIRRHIALRLVGPGEALPSERELAATFGVGRATIQRALRILEADRLIETRRGRSGGTFALQPAGDSSVRRELVRRIVSQQDKLEQLLVFRRTLEPRVAGVAARTRTNKDMKAMQGEIAAMAAAVREQAYMRHDTRFHLAVARATRNQYFMRAMEEIRMELNDAIGLLPESETWHRRLSSEHDAIVEAIALGDVQAAEAATELHVARSDQSIRALLAALVRAAR